VAFLVLLLLVLVVLQRLLLLFFFFGACRAQKGYYSYYPGSEQGPCQVPDEGPQN
jgi:hypothetical protein